MFSGWCSQKGKRNKMKLFASIILTLPFFVENTMINAFIMISPLFPSRLGTSSHNMDIFHSSSSDNESYGQEGMIPYIGKTKTAGQSRKRFLSSVSSNAFAALMSSTIVPTSTLPVNAAYGDTSNMELPNYIEFLIEKNTQVDPSKILYKGADIETQIKRISDASNRLKEVPILAKEKKWSQVQGILTGPLGTLVQTMNTLCKAENSTAANKAAAKVKSDIISISQEAAKKNEGGVVKACDEAQKDLEAFAKLVF